MQNSGKMQLGLSLYFPRRARRPAEAMATRKRIAITIETDRVVIIRRNRPTRAQCQECGSEADIVDMTTAAELTGMTDRTLRDLMDAQELQLGQSPDGSLRTCLESLLKSKGGGL